MTNASIGRLSGPLPTNASIGRLSRLSRPLPLVTGQTRTFVLSAIDEIDRGLGLGLVILFGRDEFVPVRLEELRVHGGVALSSINLALLTLGAGPSAPGAGRLLTPSQLTLPPGYRVEIVANRLNFASVVEVAASGDVYVAEAGFSYGNVRTPPRVLRVGTDGSTEVVATGFEGPIAGLAVDGNDLFVSHRGTVTRIDLRTGARADIITGCRRSATTSTRTSRSGQTASSTSRRAPPRTPESSGLTTTSSVGSSSFRRSTTFPAAT